MNIRCLCIRIECCPYSQIYIGHWNRFLWKNVLSQTLAYHLHTITNTNQPNCFINIVYFRRYSKHNDSIFYDEQCGLAYFIEHRNVYVFVIAASAIPCTNSHKCIISHHMPSCGRYKFQWSVWVSVCVRICSFVILKTMNELTFRVLHSTIEMCKRLPCRKF